MTAPLVIDCDPGIDDAIAILLALAAPEEIALAGISTVAGNKPLAKTTANALRLLELAGRTEIPVHAGLARPLMGEARPESDYHGRDGMGDTGLPAPGTAPSPVHGADFIVDTVMAAEPGTVTLCAIGPLSNVALAMTREPRLAGRIRALHIMGGEVFPAEGAPAEFNFGTDPAAAHIVLESGAPITVFGLDVTRQANIAAPLAEALRQTDTPVAAAAAAMLDVTAAGGRFVHDACTVAALLEPGIFSGREGQVHVEWRDPACEGVCRFEKAGTGHRVVTGLDPDRLLHLIAGRIAKLA